VLAEHRAVRNGVGVFDVSHLGRFALTGDGARAAVDSLLSNDLDRIEPGATQYTLMLDERAGIVDDLIVWWWAEQDFWILPNAANHQLVMDAFSACEGAAVRDLQQPTVMLAVQGPQAPDLIARIVGSAPERFRTLKASWHGHELHMAGTGYTGEPGGEISTSPPGAAELLDALIEGGAAACGLGARDTLRLEAGLPLWGEDMDRSTTPIEAALGFAAPPGRDIPGRAVLESQRESGVGRRLTGLILEDRGVPRHGYAVRSAGSSGTITSGNVSPVLNTGIGLAYMSPPIDTGVELEVEIRGRWVPGRSARPPFYRS
jgi:aminomethyltransferase